MISLILLTLDKITMTVLGSILPAFLTSDYKDESMSIMLEYGKLGMPKLLPIGVFYTTDVALDTAQLLSTEIARRQQMQREGIG